MNVFLVVEWIDGIPETIKVYSNRDSAEQFIRVMGTRNFGIKEVEVFE